MANSVYFLGWDRPTAGKEQQAMVLMQASMEFLGKMQAEGQIESFEPILLARHGGDMNGFVLIKGDADKLAALRTNDTWLDMIVAASHCLDSFGHIEGYIGDSFNDMMARYTKVISA